MDQIIQFANANPMLSAAAVAITVMALFYEIRMKTRGILDVQGPDAVRLINQGAIVLDVRNRKQFDAGHIINARLIEPDQMDSKLESLKNDLQTPIVVCCESGITSGRVAGLLKKQGHTQVFNLKGGLASWRSENYPLETKNSAKGSSRKSK